MKRPIQWSRAALDDLKHQLAYIAADNPQAARRVATCVQATCATLGHFATGRPGRVHGTHEKPVANLPYIVAYCITKQANIETISILRIIHTSRNWPEEDWPTDS